MRFGDYRLEIVSDGAFGLDGGAMFGIVPRVLWSKVAPPDDRNRIRLGLNCLFIEAGHERILIETGIGDKWSAKHAEIYAIARQRSLREAVRAATGYSAEQITIVINTHLHFDHAGGNTIRDAQEERVVPTFPNARYLVSRGEYEHAEAPTERDRASYVPDDWQALRRNGQLELIPSHYEVVPGLHVETVPGHNRTMQCVRLEQAGRTLYFFADIVPTRAHVPYAWIMSYDLFPLETLAAKKRLLPQAVREGWICYFYHDWDAPLCKLVEQEGRIVPVELKGIDVLA
ncbi:MAG: MBL fold metallo-hydrolase [Pyrinomonas sp.]|uniref:MBL fold metallo-hydrolase n=1 Tax=Pyrinomonas sp. TaxID=2080306 RepID=UPI0033296045